MTHVIEGTAEEITEVLRNSFSGRNLRVIVEDQADLAANIPPPPFAIRDEAHLVALLLAGIQSGPPTEMTKTDWDEIRKGVASRSKKRRGNPGATS